MWFNFAIIVSLLLCNCCLSSVLHESNSNGSSGGNLRQPIPDGNSKAQTKLDDLDEDVLYTIFTFFNPRSFVTMMEVKPRFAEVVRKAFRQKYRDYQIIMGRFDRYYGESREEYYDAYPQMKGLRIVDEDLALKTLLNFGTEIKDLEIVDCNFEGNQSIIINRFANKFASESLTRFYSQHTSEHTFSQFTKPFTAVEEFICMLDEGQVGDILPFNEIFPNLKRFNLNVRSPNRSIDYSMFDVHLPNLEYLEIHAGMYHHVGKFDGIVSKNTQIQGASLLDFAEDYIRNIDQFLPKVVNLTLRNFSTKNKPIHVNNVKHFYMDYFIPDYIEQLTFSELISMKLKFHPIRLENWRSFFRNHKTVTKLTVETDLAPIGQELVEITNELPNLVDLKINDIDETYIDVISKIIQSHDKLRRFEFRIVRSCDVIDTTQLHELFDNGWHINYDERSIKYDARIIFEKKENED